MPIFDPVELYRARGLPEAHALRLALEQQGIAVRIDNEMLQGVVGELPMGWATAPRVMVDRMQADSAVNLLKGFLERQAEAADADEDTGDDDSEGGCLACGADMGEAEACPACGWSFGTDPEALPDDGEP